ncbi:MAG: chromate transporter [Lentisphaeria bacterium]|nr:chromate transporter [Lentisphaeria bacterium]
MSLLILFYQFAKFGLLCFGGGYMLIPLFIAEFVGEGKLLTPERFGNLVSVSQVTPGPVGINTATFIGFIQNHFWGALAATCGLVFPTLILAGFAVSLIKRYQETALLKGILYGARLAAVALIFYAVTVFLELSVFPGGGPWKLIGGGIENFRFSISGAVIMALSCLCIAKFKVSTTKVIIGSAILGAVTYPFIG